MKTTGSSPPVRLTRDAFEEDSVTGGSSKEDHVSSAEQVQPSDNKKPMREFSRIKLRKNAPSKPRSPRESHEKVDKSKKNTTVTHQQRNEAQTKQKTTLVKKPLPKYNDMDYDDDFQMKISRAPVRTVDSGEHEDEDFNLEDYDFDVNHDEFIGRGKPLEPRVKTKVIQASRPAEKQAPRPEPKVQSKATAPLRRHVANKREERRAVQKPAKKAGDKEDYYDDATTSQKTPEKGKLRDSDDEFNEDNEEADEFEAKGRSVRTIRSPFKMNGYMDKFNDKSSSVMSKVLSILPMFPEVPKKTEKNKISPSMNPWRASP